jgi:hypothetical protein
MNELRQAAEMALKYFENAHGLEDTEVAIKEALRQALAKPERISIDWKKSLGGIRQHALEDTHSV